MADETVGPKIEIEGLDELIAKLGQLGDAGTEAFEKINEAASKVSKAGDSVEEAAEHGKKSLNELGIIGAEAFERILEAASNGNLVGIVTATFGKLAGALTEVAQKAFEFIEAQGEMIETLENLANISGVTLGQIEGLKDAFASVGVSTSGFERVMGRLAITVGQQWSQIQQAVRTSADQQTGAMLHIQETTIGVRKAYEAVSDANTNMTQSAQHNALAVESAALTLRRAGEALGDFTAKSQHNALSVESAQLALVRARMNLAKDQGFEINPQDEKRLKIQQDQLAVQEAVLRIQDAQRTRMKEALEMEELQLHVKKAQQEASDADQKRIDDSVKASERLRDAQLNVQKALLAQREASEKLHEQDLRDIPKIAKEVEQVTAGYKTWDDVMNHAEISAQTLAKAVELAAKGGTENGQPPTAIEVFKELTSLFQNMGDSADANAKKIELVQHLMAAGFRAGQASAAQIVAVINRGPEAIDKMMASMKEFSESLDLKEAAEKTKDFNSAFAQMNTVIDNVKIKIASGLSPAFTEAFDAIRESIKEPTGALNEFGRFVAQIAAASVPMWKAIGAAIGAVWDTLKGLVEAIAALSGETVAETLQRDFLGVANVFNVVAVAIGGVEAVLGVLVFTIGKVVAAWKAMPKALGGEGKSFEDAIQGQNEITKIGASMIVGGGRTAAGGIDRFTGNLASAGNPALATNLSKPFEDAAAKEKEAADKMHESGEKHDEAAGAHKEAAAKLEEAVATLPAATEKMSGHFDEASDRLKDSAGALSDAAALFKSVLGSLAAGMKGMPAGLAGGGPIRGPGGPADDRAGLFALSDGEYVVRSAAVSHYGEGLFHALNNLAVGGFATGGMVGGARAPGVSAGAQIGPSSVLNLTIDGQHFDGLKAPEHVASKLKSYAVTRQSSSAGKMPTWMR